MVVGEAMLGEVLHWERRSEGYVSIGGGAGGGCGGVPWEGSGWRGRGAG